MTLSMRTNWCLLLDAAAEHLAFLSIVDRNSFIPNELLGQKTNRGTFADPSPYRFLFSVFNPTFKRRIGYPNESEIKRRTV